MKFYNLGNNINICGLHSFRIDIEEEKATNMEISIKNDSQEIANCVSPFFSGTSQIIFFTQLIPDGKYTINCEVFDEGGTMLHQRSPEMLVYNTDNDLNEKVTNLLKDNNVPILKAGRASMRYLDKLNTQNLTAWFNKPGSDEFIQIQNNATPFQQDVLTQFTNNGYAIIKNLLNEEELKEANINLDEAAANGFSGYVKGSSQKLYNLHQKYPIFAKFLRHPKVYDILRFLFQSEPLACQSLTFVCGSQQSAHLDSSFLTPFPQGYMCGVWIALEDIQPNSGELFYHKKSHLAERYTCPIGHGEEQYKVGQRFDNFEHEHNAVVNANKNQYPEKEFFRAKAGDTLIWHEKLLHGGAPRVDKFTTRKSVVFHYFADGAIAIFDDRGVVPKLNNRYGLN